MWGWCKVTQYRTGVAKLFMNRFNIVYVILTHFVIYIRIEDVLCAWDPDHFSFYRIKKTKEILKPGSSISTAWLFPVTFVQPLHGDFVFIIGPRENKFWEKFPQSNSPEETITWNYVTYSSPLTSREKSSHTIHTHVSLQTRKWEHFSSSKSISITSLIRSSQGAENRGKREHTVENNLATQKVTKIRKS